MAWSTLPTYTDGTVLTAAMLLAIRDNINESAPAKATVANSIFVSTGPNAIAERVPTRITVPTSQTTTSVAAYGDLATVGPTVPTLATGVAALVFMTTTMSNSTAGGGGFMSFAVSGATTIAGSDDRSIRQISSNINEAQRVTGVHHQISLTAGSNTFTAKYTTPTGGTATFVARELGVLPL